jgi:hypothetical protein
MVKRKDAEERVSMMLLELLKYWGITIYNDILIYFLTYEMKLELSVTPFV